MVGSQKMSNLMSSDNDSAEASRVLHHSNTVDLLEPSVPNAGSSYIGVPCSSCMSAPTAAEVQGCQHNYHVVDREGLLGVVEMLPHVIQGRGSIDDAPVEYV